MFDFFFSSNAIWLSPGRLSRRKASCKLQIQRINAEWCGVWLHWCRKSHIDSRKRAFLRAYKIFSVQRLIAFARSLCAGKSVACMQFFNELMQWRHPSYTKMGFKKFWGRAFPRMRSKGSRFTLGVWGLRVCSLDVASASATVRNRSQPSARSPYGRAYGKFCRGGHFWRFQTCRCFVSRGRRGTSWHSDVFCNVLKIVLHGRRNTFVTFSEDVLQFSWQAQHFGRVHRHFSWQAQHFRRVLLRVFCKSHWQGCVKWWQGANSVAGVAFADMCWKLTEASHETSILRLQIFRF